MSATPSPRGTSVYPTVASSSSVLVHLFHLALCAGYLPFQTGLVSEFNRKWTRTPLQLPKIIADKEFSEQEQVYMVYASALIPTISYRVTRRNSPIGWRMCHDWVSSSVRSKKEEVALL